MVLYGKRGRPRDRLYRPLYRDVIGMIAPLVFLAFALALLFSPDFKAAIGLGSVKVSIDLLTFPPALYWSYRAASRFFSDHPILEVRRGKLVGHWSFKRLPVVLSDIESVTIHRRIAPWRTGGNSSPFTPPYWLHIGIGGKKPGALCIAPGQVLGGLIALRRFAEALRARRKEWQARPVEHDIYDEIWGIA